MYTQRRCYDFYEQVCIGYFFRGPLQDLLSPCNQSTCIDLAHKVKVWYARPALCGALGHNAPDTTQGQFSGNGCRSVLAGGSTPCRQNVRGQHGTFWTGSLNGRDIFALFACQPSRPGRSGWQARLAVECQFIEHVRSVLFLVLDICQHVRFLNTSSQGG